MSLINKIDYYMMYIGLIYNKRNRYGYEQPVEQFFFTMDQNFFLNKIPFLNCPGSQTTVTVKTEKGYTKLGISADTDMSVRPRGNPGKPWYPSHLNLKKTNKKTN